MKKLILLILLCVTLSCGAQTRPCIIDSQFIENIAALRALVPSTSAQYTAIVNGYTTRSDGGGGTFIWSTTSTATDDGGLVIKPTATAGGAAGRWLRDCEPNVVNVRHFGAKGDAVVTAIPYVAATHTEGEVSSYTGTIHEFSGTDDTAAFQRAYATMDSGKTLYIPPGNYRINGNDAGWSSGAAWDDRPGMVFDNKNNIVIKGDGESSKLCVAYNTTTGETVASNTFLLFQFKDSAKSSISRLNIDFQAVGWSPAQTAAPPSGALDDAVKICGVLSVESISTGSSDITVDSCFLRVNHPFGSYFGEAYAPSKYSTKLMAMWFHGVYGTPTSLSTEPAADAVMVENCRVTNNTFYEGQPYPVFLWMTDSILIANNYFMESGGLLPTIRAPHLNINTQIVNNYFRINPAWFDGSGVSYCIYFFENSGWYIPEGVLIQGNNILVSDGVDVSPILFNGGENITITENRILCLRSAVSVFTSFSGIRFANVLTWAAFGDKGEARRVVISGNQIKGLFYNGISADATAATISDNTVLGTSNFGIQVSPRSLGIISGNNIRQTSIGLQLNTPATSTADLRFSCDNNQVLDCDIGISSANQATTALGVFHHNFISDCATGTANLLLSKHRMFNNYYASCTADLDSATLLVASMTEDLTSTVGAWKSYGSPGVATSGY
jgi:hypothetical protein